MARIRPGEQIVSGDLARRIKLNYGLEGNDPRILRAMAYKTFKARMRALVAVIDSEREG